MKNQDSTTKTTKAPGFFKRMIDKLDSSMKEKADEKAKQGDCCGPNSGKGKGGKCC